MPYVITTSTGNSISDENTATVRVDGHEVTGTVYHVRENGWACVQCAGHVASGPAVVSRVAVATLDDIRRFIIEKHEEQGVWIGGDALHGPVDRLASGPVTVGPLPDGTIIEVEHRSFGDLATQASMGAQWIVSESDVLAAFNAS